MRRHAGIAAAILLAAITGSPTVARGWTRPRFEPTDIEWEETGFAELDLQIGPMRSPGPWRIVVPDFELDLGLLPWLELDLDGAYAVEGPATGPFSLDHAAPDSLWPCAKLGLYGFHAEGTKSGGALGLQVGPKLPTGAARGLGVEALLLLGGVRGPVTAALNFGAFIDPAPDAASWRPRGIEVGIDLELSPNDLLSLTGELAAVHFTSRDPDQLQASLGAVWAANSNLDLSLTGLIGTLTGGDRYGILFGVSPKVRLFH